MSLFPGNPLPPSYFVTIVNSNFGRHHSGISSPAVSNKAGIASQKGGGGNARFSRLLQRDFLWRMDPLKPSEPYEVMCTTYFGWDGVRKLGSQCSGPPGAYFYFSPLEQVARNLVRIFLIPFVFASFVKSCDLAVGGWLVGFRCFGRTAFRSRGVRKRRSFSLWSVTKSARG